jgi:hypothetical protein
MKEDKSRTSFVPINISRIYLYQFNTKVYSINIFQDLLSPSNANSYNNNNNGDDDDNNNNNNTTRPMDCYSSPSSNNSSISSLNSANINVEKVYNLIRQNGISLTQSTNNQKSKNIC